ncbi:D-glycero-alpha-D-manno-heptose-1,7-bisphosphate 7-phosphatase [Alteromonas sp. CYL-A6]|uniref:D-glycero-alpha-D-manno-heptose-1,7-bisphosphate 7-phosphatase n=1 Tax=Alteromonas nitratireducens TaxID=3390813 RepID=UPI0034AE5541
MVSNKKVLLLDRDGTLNVKAPGHGYIYLPSQFEFLPGVIDALALLTQAGFRFMVITNQAGVSKGLYTEAQVNTLHRYMCEQLAGHGIAIDDIIFCPHFTESCQCRKPKPGMFTTLADRHGLTLSDLIYVGDDPRDMVAARNAGVQGLKLGDDENGDDASKPTVGYADSLLDAVPMIIDWYQKHG